MTGFGLAQRPRSAGEMRSRAERSKSLMLTSLNATDGSLSGTKKAGFVAKSIATGPGGRVDDLPQQVYPKGCPSLIFETAPDATCLH